VFGIFVTVEEVPVNATDIAHKLSRLYRCIFLCPTPCPSVVMFYHHATQKHSIKFVNLV